MDAETKGEERIILPARVTALLHGILSLTAMVGIFRRYSTQYVHRLGLQKGPNHYVANPLSFISFLKVVS